MVKYRFPNSSCLTCGSQVPAEVTRERNGDYVEYRCASCNATILSGLLAEDGEFANSPARPPGHTRDITVPDRIEWDTWETWWTDRIAIVLIHGRVIHGNSALVEFRDKLQSIYDQHA